MFEPGDKVVCLRETCECCGDGNTFEDGHVKPVRGRYYTVARASMGLCVGCGAVANTFEPVTPTLPEGKVWPEHCFRKVEGGDADVFKLARVKEPA